MRYPLPVSLLLSTALVCSGLFAHPNYQATRRSDVAIVPATEPASPAARVSVTVEGDKRVVTANGLPDHATGRFPNANNPNSIAPQNYRYTMPARPVVNATP